MAAALAADVDAKCQDSRNESQHTSPDRCECHRWCYLLEVCSYVAVLGSWALLCSFEILAVWPEPQGRWPQGVAIAILTAASLTCLVRALAEVFLSQQAAIIHCCSKSSHAVVDVLLIGGCLCWLLFHVVHGQRPQICTGSATLWSLIALALQHRALACTLTAGCSAPVARAQAIATQSVSTPCLLTSQPDTVPKKRWSAIFPEGPGAEGSARSSMCLSADESIAPIDAAESTACALPSQGSRHSTDALQRTLCDPWQLQASGAESELEQCARLPCDDEAPVMFQSTGTRLSTASMEVHSSESRLLETSLSIFSGSESTPLVHVKKKPVEEDCSSFGDTESDEPDAPPCQSNTEDTVQWISVAIPNLSEGSADIARQGSLQTFSTEYLDTQNMTPEVRSRVASLASLETATAVGGLFADSAAPLKSTGASSPKLHLQAASSEVAAAGAPATPFMAWAGACSSSVEVLAENKAKASLREPLVANASAAVLSVGSSTPEIRSRAASPVIEAPAVTEPSSLPVRTKLGEHMEMPETVKDEPHGLEREEADEVLPASGELCPIEPGKLREAFLVNLRRRGVRLGEPVGGARIEQLHELLSEGEDWLPDSMAARPSLSGMLTPGDIGESLSRRMSQTDQNDGIPLSVVTGEHMSFSEFQNLRETVQAAEAGLTLLRPSFMSSKRDSYMSSKRDSRASHRNSVVASLQASLRASPSGSQRASLVASPRRSRNASLVPSQTTSKVTSRRNSSMPGSSPSLTSLAAPMATGGNGGAASSSSAAGRSSRLNSSDGSATTPYADSNKAAAEGADSGDVDSNVQLSFALPKIKEGSPSPAASEGGAELQSAKTADDTRLREALEAASPDAKLKDLLLVDSEIGDLCLEKFLGLVTGQAGSVAKVRGLKASDTQSVSESDFGEDDEDEDDEEDTVDEESAEGEGWRGPADSTMLALDPNLLQHVMKMLIMLNDGLQTRHCNCPPGGPHTCMSPVASLLVSQVQSLHHSLCNSVGQSVVQTVQPSRRGSGSYDRKELTPIVAMGSRKQRNSGGSDAVSTLSGAGTNGSGSGTAPGSGGPERRRSRLRTASIVTSTCADTAANAASSPAPAPRSPTSCSAADAGAGPAT